MADLPTGTVSFLFTDIEGSTELLQHLGDRAYGQVLMEHQSLLREAFQQEEGHVVDTQGDSFFVAFPRAWNAVSAAVAGQQAVAAHTWPEGVSLKVRMGVHTGEPTLAGNHYVGLDVHRAARIAAAGHGGQVLLSERAHAMTLGALRDAVRVKDLGDHRLKGLARAEHIFQLIVPGLPTEFPSLKSLEVLTTNLPSLQLTSFIGREREMAEIEKLVSTSRLVTLMGPGGAGKTRLALQVGSTILERYPHGVWLAELAPLSDPAFVPQTVATIFGVRELAGRALLETLVDYLRTRELLLVLDNCEHLVKAAAELAGALLRNCPQLRILATSREALGVAGELPYRVPPLSRPDPRRRLSLEQLTEFEAARLFIERAVLSNPKFAATEVNANAVAQVCHQLDGIPLAIELAAARVKVLSVEQIAKRLDDRFRLLTGGGRAGLPHHQTLRAAVDWSHELLSGEERVLFRRLAVFAGGFSLEAAEAVCADGDIGAGDVLDLVARLADKSLVITEEVVGDVRYRLLETIRAYSRERLVESGEADAVRQRHLEWHLDLAERAEPELRGPEQITWLDRLEMEHDNLRAALDWTKTDEASLEKGLRLAGAVHGFWTLRGYLSEGREWLGGILAKGSGASHRARAKALYAAGVLAFHQGDYGQAAAMSGESLALYRSLDDNLGVALSLNTLGIVTRNRGDYKKARALLEESLALSRQSGHKWALAEGLNVLGVTARRQGDHGLATKMFTESLALWRELGDKWGLAASLGHLGVVARQKRDYERAKALHGESLALRRELGDKRLVAADLSSLGFVARDLGKHEE
ncbi:MAG: tetratricopeptide repeat protein, partial [bacterium]